MSKPIASLVALTCLFGLSTSAVSGDPPREARTFTIVLEGVSEEDARNDLVNFFVRDNQTQLRIDLTLQNRQVTVGRSKPTYYYLEKLRVAPGQTLRIVPGGRLPDYEARIQSVEARFPIGKPPLLLITASAPPDTPGAPARPYPMLSKEGFNGRRELVLTAGKQQERKPDRITCNGDTPGDLRIRFGSLVEVEDVGLAFSTRYRIDESQHRYDAANGLQTRYFGTATEP